MIIDINNNYVLSAGLSANDKWLMFIRTTQLVEMDVEKPMLIIPKAMLEKMADEGMVQRNNHTPQEGNERE